LLHLRAAEAVGVDDAERLEHELYDRRFLVARPLLQAVEASTAQRPAVLLVDEVDRADDEFEAFLLEVLGDFTVSIPEIGTIRAEHPPVVVVTSNRTREVHDALKRRCLYHWLDHPDFEREVAVIRRRIPGADQRLVSDVARAAQRLRRMDLVKPPGLAESIDWAAALATLGATGLDRDLAARTLGAAVKYREDQERVLAAVGDGGFT
jgi:MoxR-like ATPase